MLGRIRLALSVCSIALLVSLALAGAAQAANVRFGLLGGIGFSKFTGIESSIVEFQGIRAPALGVLARIEVTPTLSVEPEALWVSDGISFGESEHTDEQGNPLGKVETLHVLERVQIPVLLRYSPASAGPIRMFGLLGPYAALRVAEYLRTTGGADSKTTSKALKSSDVGLTFGGGVDMPLGPGRAELQARYDAGIVGLGHYYSSSSTRTGALRLLAGYRF